MIRAITVTQVHGTTKTQLFKNKYWELKIYPVKKEKEQKVQEGI